MAVDVPRPQISLPNQPKGKSSFEEDDDETSNDKQSQANAKTSTPAKSQAAIPKQEKPANTGWFGGIWNRLALRPKNQMKLPDDKNPTIVWDPEKKRWINTEEDNNEGGSEIKPPPKMSDLMGSKVPVAGPPPGNSPPSGQNNSQPGGPMVSNQSGMRNASSPPMNQDDSKPPLPSQPNMFKLQRSRAVKNSYVDVFNPGGKPTVNASTLPAPDNFGMAPAAQPPQMNFFIPQPITDPNAPINFLTPAPVNIDNSQMSRWSSASSLSREVQSYTMRKPVPR